MLSLHCLVGDVENGAAFTFSTRSNNKIINQSIDIFLSPSGTDALFSSLVSFFLFTTLPEPNMKEIHFKVSVDDKQSAHHMDAAKNKPTLVRGGFQTQFREVQSMKTSALDTI